MALKIPRKECKFWSHPDTHSENIRTVIPGLSGHPFWIYPDTFLGLFTLLFKNTKSNEKDRYEKSTRID